MRVAAERPLRLGPWQPRCWDLAEADRTGDRASDIPAARRTLRLKGRRHPRQVPAIRRQVAVIWLARHIASSTDSIGTSTGAGDRRQVAWDGTQPHAMTASRSGRVPPVPGPRGAPRGSGV